MGGGRFWLGQNEIGKVWGRVGTEETPNLVKPEGQGRRDRTPGKEVGARAMWTEVCPGAEAAVLTIVARFSAGVSIMRHFLPLCH